MCISKALYISETADIRMLVDNDGVLGWSPEMYAPGESLDINQCFAGNTSIVITFSETNRREHQCVGPVRRATPR